MLLFIGFKWRWKCVQIISSEFSTPVTAPPYMKEKALFILFQLQCQHIRLQMPWPLSTGDWSPGWVFSVTFFWDQREVYELRVKETQEEQIGGECNPYTAICGSPPPETVLSLLCDTFCFPWFIHSANEQSWRVKHLAWIVPTSFILLIPQCPRPDKAPFQEAFQWPPFPPISARDLTSLSSATCKYLL